MVKAEDAPIHKKEIGFEIKLDQSDEETETIPKKVEKERVDQPDDVEEPAYYYCLPCVQEWLNNDLNEYEAEKTGYDDCWSFDMIRNHCISTDLNQYGRDNEFTTALLPYCLNSLKYTKTREHPYYVIWETFVNINFILAYIIFFSIHTIGYFMIMQLIPGCMFFLLFCSAFAKMNNPSWVKIADRVIILDIFYHLRKLCTNKKYMVAIPLIAILYIIVFILIICLTILYVLLAIIVDIVIIVVGIILELILLILLIMFLTIWNIIFCFYPISKVIYYYCKTE